MKVLFWHVLLEIKRPEAKTASGIILTDDVQDAESALTMVGRVIEIGPMAFKTKTSGGHDYSLHVDDVKIGDWVLTSRKIGVPIKNKDGRTFQLCNDYEILAAFDNEQEASQVKAYI